MDENEISKVIVDAAVDVHRTLGGPGMSAPDSIQSLPAPGSSLLRGQSLAAETTNSLLWCDAMACTPSAPPIDVYVSPVPGPIAPRLQNLSL